MHGILLIELEWTTNHTVVFKRDPVRQGHVTLSVTLMHRVTLENYSVDFHPFEFHEQNYMHISSKIISVAYPEPEI